jgi:NAD+ diphosphatase
MPRNFIPAFKPPEEPTEPKRWFLFQGSKLLLVSDVAGVMIPERLPDTDLGLLAGRQQYLGLRTGPRGNEYCYCGELPEDFEPPPGMVFEQLRPLYSMLEESDFWLAGRAIQIVSWDRDHRYCGRCGNRTIDQTLDRSKVCPNCGQTQYPRLAPAVIVRIQRQIGSKREILLARSQRFRGAMFSVLAGFVEPGETLEDCVEREIAEETGIRVKDIAYFGSQPWPFPHSLMIAFTAEYESGELTIDRSELAEAGWFTAKSLPSTPPPPSIANRLITTWLQSV